MKQCNNAIGDEEEVYEEADWFTDDDDEEYVNYDKDNDDDDDVDVDDVGFIFSPIN